MPRYASSTDVARLAGVSQSAVSRAYRPGASVSAETRAKVLEAAELLGYRPSLIPQIMRDHRSYLVAVVVGGLYNPFYAQVLEEFARQFQGVGNQVLLVHVDSGYSLDEAIPKLASYRVDAVVSALAVLSNESAEALARLRIPVVAFNTVVMNDWVSSVSCANREAGETIAELFLARGARTFGYVTGPVEAPASGERLSGFRDLLAGEGFCDLHVARGDFRYEAGARAVVAMLAEGPLPEAIFCANDLTAMGVIDAIRAAGACRVPEDVMVAGFDGIPQSAWLAYDLTTFEQDAVTMVRRAIEIATATAGQPTGGVGVTVSPRLVERGSTRFTGRTSSTPAR